MTKFIYRPDVDGDLIPAIEQEVSKIAARSYTQDGNSMYDSLRVSTSDIPLVKGFISDALDGVVAVYDDLCLRVEGGIEFLVPDFAEERILPVYELLKRYVVLNTCLNHVNTKGTSVEQSLSNRCEAVMQRLTVALYLREYPKVTEE